jgi:hypothetical protein
MNTMTPSWPTTACRARGKELVCLGFFDLDYDSMKVMTNDLWKRRPPACRTTASSSPAPSTRELHGVPDPEREVFFYGGRRGELPASDDLVKAKISHRDTRRPYETRTALRQASPSADDA